MPRKLTKNATALQIRGLNQRLRNDLCLALRFMQPLDKVLLAEILERYEDMNPGEYRLASAFERSISLSYCAALVVDGDEYRALLKRLDEAEAFRRKVVMMPARDVV